MSNPEEVSHVKLKTMDIQKGTPAIYKYIRAFFTDKQGEYFEACVRHGMKYGKTRAEATDTERFCYRLMNSIVNGALDPHQVRSNLFAIQTAYSESSKSRNLYEHFLTGNGVEIGSGGWPMVPHAIQVELSHKTYAKYNSGNVPEIPVQWHSDDMSLPFKDSTMDWVSSSHLIEDFADWNPLLREWVRILKPGGHLVILVPDKALWDKAIREGQPPNCAHRHESYVGELSTYAPGLGLEVIMDQLAGDKYSIVFVGRKL